MKKILIPSLMLSLALAAVATAHDTWLQLNTNLVRVGDAVHVDLMLGNHGNEHRDFKLAGKVTIDDKVTLNVIGPDGKSRDLKPTLTDNGYGPREGYWTARVSTDQPGLYTVVQSSDTVVTYAPLRSVKSAKSFFVASTSLDKPQPDNKGFDRVFGHALELVPQTNPVTPMGPGTTLTVRLLYKGKPLSDATVSFIPRGETLSEKFDARYERKTNEHGDASFEPTDGNQYLVVAHHADGDKGQGYDATKYSATIGLYVPAVCPCCGN
jgi:uncharacterized GH25 family protein